MIIPVFSNANQIGGKVKGFLVDDNGGARVRLVENNSDCATGSSGWDYRFSTESDKGRLWSSMIIAARMSDKIIRIGYTPNESGSCLVTFVYFYDY